jgi:hypothetical protein
MRKVLVSGNVCKVMRALLGKASQDWFPSYDSTADKGKSWTSGKTCCLGISCSKLVCNIYLAAQHVGFSVQVDWQL